MLRIVVISGVTAFAVFVVLTVVGIGAYYFAFRDAAVNNDGASTGDSPADRLRRAGRTLTGSKTDAAKITSVSFRTWGHAGVLYPGPNEPPGYVFSDSVEFRRDLNGVRETKKDYDRDLPDETSMSAAKLTDEQFVRLVEACVQSDIINESNSTKVRSEGGATLLIEYSGEKKSLVTSNIGQDTEEVAKVLAAIKQLENSVTWAPAHQR